MLISCEPCARCFVAKTGKGTIHVPGGDRNNVWRSSPDG